MMYTSQVTGSIALAGHLSREEIYDRYRQMTGARQRTHWQVIYLKSQNKVVSEIAEATGYGEDWIRQIILNYNDLGPDAFVVDQPLPPDVQAEYARKTSELAAAREAQQKMLATAKPEAPGLDISVFLKTATEVSGDYYDFMQSEDGALTFAIGDATGHGTLAGMMVVATKALFKVLGGQRNLLAVARKISATLKSLGLRGTYMHMTLARYRKGMLRLVVAGMPPILIYRARTGRVEELAIRGMPLGSFTEYPYEMHTEHLDPGDVVLLMSDGLPELLGPCGEMLQIERVSDIFAEAVNRSADDIIQHLRRAGIAWRAERPLNDDVTMLVIKRLGC